MGWLFYRRDKGESNVEHFQKAFGSNYEIIDGATVAGTFYAAARERATGLVSCAVILTRWIPNDHYNFGYKDMSESMGPGKNRCPARILDLLSPTDELYGPSLTKQACEKHSNCSWKPDEEHVNQRDEPDGARAWADKWRADCRAEIEKRGRVTRGTRIRLPFIDSPYKVWEAADLRRNRFYPVSEAGETIVWGPPTRIPWWRNSSYEVVT